MAEGKTSTVSAVMRVGFPPESVWPLLCPVREYDWIEPWDCELVQSDSGVNELGCVFRTEFPTEGGPDTWVTSRYEPPTRLEFVRVNDWRAIRFVIELEPEADATRLTWTHHVVPFGEAGEAYVRKKPEAFAAQMGMLEKMLVHYLETGQMLRGDDSGLVKEMGAHVYGGKTG